MLQPDALTELLKGCQAAGVHTAVDTAGNVPWESFEQVLPYTDLFLYDIKAMDSDVHKTCTGVGNERILENFTRLADLGANIFVRYPYIPGMNDDQAEKIAGFLSRCSRSRQSFCRTTSWEIPSTGRWRHRTCLKGPFR